MFKSHIYLRIYKNRLVIRCIETGVEKDINSSVPFSTERLLVGEFTKAEKLLGDMMKDIKPRRFLPVSLHFLVQPCEMIDGGLSEIENKIFYELPYSVGAKKSVLWVGPVLSDEQVVEKLKIA